MSFMWRILLLCGSLWFLAGNVAVGQGVDTTGQAKRQELYLEALDLMAGYKYAEAQELLSQCYIEEPRNLEYLLKIAYCNDQSGRYPDAKMFYNEALKVDSLNTTAISALGALYEKELNYRKAFGYYQYLIQMDTSNGYYYKRNGYLALRLGDPIAAAGYFLRAYELNSGDVEAMIQLSSIYLALDQYDYAEEMTRKVGSVDPRNIKNLQNRARLFQKQKDYEGVVRNVQKAMESGDTSAYYQMLLGVAYVELDSLDQAVETLQALSERKEDNEYTHHYLAIAYRDKGVIDTSLLHFEKAIELGTSPKMHVFHDDLARVYTGENQHRKALTHYEKAYEYEKDPAYLFHMGRSADLYYKDKNIALRYYKRYVTSGHQKYKTYTLDRIKQLKEVLHFQGGF
jgi:tetratricopeptide (TPR) repeat protein